ncbi:MAG: tetratricopeptide repeat protein [Alistipes sp.]|nr:tetratricopeptide repeat protein [Alistipes sp.]
MRALSKHILRLLAVVVLLVSGEGAVAQYLPERALVREGNTQFERRNYRTALNRYNEALECDSTSYEAAYNRANAYHHLKLTSPADSTLKWEVANEYFEYIARDTLLTTVQRAETLRNLGESLFTQQRYEAALNSFRESLLLNPDDRETKHNYVLTKRIVDQKRHQQQQQDQQNQDQQQQGDGGGGGQNDQQQDQQQDEQQNQNNEQQNDQNKNQDQQQDNKGQDDKQQDKNQQQENDPNNPNEQPNEGDDEREGQAPPPQGISREEQERMLDAIQAEEDKTQDKLKEGEKVLVIPGKKNW